MVGFGKRERLCSRKGIEELFATGRKVTVYPFSVRWLYLPEVREVPAQVLFLVPKRRVRLAVNRNRVKRLMRECYRSEKESLYDRLREQQCHLQLAIVYLHSKPKEYAQVQEGMRAVLRAVEEGCTMRREGCE